MRPSEDGTVAETMFGDVLGDYPQPPFLLHAPNAGETQDAFESIRAIMSAVDGVEYPSWTPFELESFCGVLES